MDMRILVVDDHGLFRDGMVSLLKAAGRNVVGEAENGLEAIEQADLLRPDLILMDIDMPIMNGLDALQRIRRKLPATKIVMLTVSNEDANLIKAVQAGAAGYLLKNLNAEEFLESLDGLQRGEVAMTHKTVSQMVTALANEEQRKARNLGQAQLTARETELLQFVAEGMSNREIAESMHISKNTVKYHMKNILQKMNLQNRAEAAAYAVRKGLVKDKENN